MAKTGTKRDFRMTDLKDTKRLIKKMIAGTINKQLTPSQASAINSLIRTWVEAHRIDEIESKIDKMILILEKGGDDEDIKREIEKITTTD